MKTVIDLIPKTRYKLKAPYTMNAEYITVHNTANDAPAINEINYMKGNPVETGFHVAIDDVEARIGIPFDRNAFHAGDGTKGNGNRKSIGIEICYSKSGGPKYRKAEQNAITFIAVMLDEYGWDINRVRSHKQWSGKNCPHRILDEKRWESFLKEIELKLKELKGGNDMSKEYAPGSSTLVEGAELFLERATKDGIINSSHLNDFKKGLMTTDRLLGLKILIDEARRGVK